MKRRKKPGKRVTLVIDAEIIEHAQQVAYDSRDTLSGFTQDALAVRLGRYETPAEYVAKRRAKGQRSPVSMFDLRLCHPCGLPRGTPASLYFSKARPGDEVQNLRALVDLDPPGALDLLVQAWESAGLDAYTVEHWKATQTWFKNNPADTIRVNPSTDEARADWEQ